MPNYPIFRPLAHEDGPALKPSWTLIVQRPENGVVRHTALPRTSYRRPRDPRTKKSRPTVGGPRQCRTKGEGHELTGQNGGKELHLELEIDPHFFRSF